MKHHPTDIQLGRDERALKMTRDASGVPMPPPQYGRRSGLGLIPADFDMLRP